MRTPPRESSSVLTHVLIAAFGAFVLGHALDYHAHRCESCGHRWRHLGAFSLGDLASHTCGRCGAVQWWKSGWQGAEPRTFDGALEMRTPRAAVALAPQEFRDVRHTALALVSSP